MGNICGKEEPDSSPPGRVLGTAPPSQNKASVPKKVGGPPRTLRGGSTTPGETSTADAAEARRKAAEAAESRAQASQKGGGKLQTQLDAQKRQTRNNTLKQMSAEEHRAREIQHNEASRTYN